MTIKDLKDKIKDLDDNIEVITTSSNYELRNNVVPARAIVSKYTKKKKSFYDDFDYTSYSEDVYCHDDKGTECLFIIG